MLEKLGPKCDGLKGSQGKGRLIIRKQEEKLFDTKKRLEKTRSLVKTRRKMRLAERIVGEKLIGHLGDI